MNKRKITLLLGLMAIGVVSLAMDDNSEALRKDQKPLSLFDINDRVRFDDNRLEVNGNLHLNKDNRLEVRVRNSSNVGETLGSETGNGTGKIPTVDNIELRMRLHTQTSIENLEVRTELKTTTIEDDGNKQYFRVQPTYYLYNENNSYSLLRAGFGYEHKTDGSDAYSFTTSSENKYAINNYLSIEGNIYYDYTFASSNNQHNDIVVEAYVFANYPLYEKNNIKIEALFEGGADPYSFGARHFDDLKDVNGSKTENGYEAYTIYAQPSIKATKRLNESNLVYLEAGYLIEVTDQNDITSPNWSGRSDKYNDTGFLRVGFSSKF